MFYRWILLINYKSFIASRVAVSNLEFADIGIWLLFIVIIAFIWRFKDRQTQRSGEEPEVLELPVEAESEEEP